MIIPEISHLVDSLIESSNRELMLHDQSDRYFKIQKSIDLLNEAYGLMVNIYETTLDEPTYERLYAGVDH